MSQLPQELIDFCFRKGSLLLIKGESGTGKTILSLEFLRVLADKKSGVYLSTRVSPKRLFRQFPDLKDLMEYVVRPETEIEPKEQTNEILDVFDLRVGEAPALIDHLYSLANKIENPILLVDSWDAIATKLSPESRVKMEDWLEVLITKTDAVLILVSEEPKQTRMDYLADGIVTLTKSRFEDRLIREIEINKLRGIRVGLDKYLFTLEDGRFRYFKPWRWQTIPQEERKLPLVKEDENPETVSTCIQGLDELLSGGWEQGSFNLFEMGEGVGDDYFVLVAPAAISYLNMGRTFRGFSGGREVKYLINSLPKLTKKIEKRMLFTRLSKTPIPKEHRRENIVNIDSSDPAEAEKSLEQSFLEAEIKIVKSKDGVSLSYIDANVIERELGHRVLIDVLSMEADLVKNSLNVDLVTMSESQKNAEDIKHLASTHWRIRRKNGVLVFYGVVPHTGAHIIETSVEKSYLETTITPIV